MQLTDEQRTALRRAITALSRVHDVFWISPLEELLAAHSAGAHSAGAHSAGARDEAKEYALLTLRRITSWPDGGNYYGQAKIKSYVIDSLAEIERLEQKKGK